jgi:MYXO-CTERM domain-containing protein
MAPVLAPVFAPALALLLAPHARAGEVIVNPYAPTHAPAVLDLSHGPVRHAPVDSGVRFEDLDAYRLKQDPTWPEGQHIGALPEGWVQQGGVVVPRAIAEGGSYAPPEWTDTPGGSFGKVEGPSAADLCMFPEETPAGIYAGTFNRGSEYPRRGTIYMNYMGGKLQNGGENSAENKSTLAKSGSTYPVYGGGEAKAIAVAQAVQTDFESMAVRVVYLERPPKRLPYVMIMMGGHWSDTASGPSGGVAPGADCEDTGLRNVCYAFVNGAQVTNQSNVASQEIGHTMGLGHTYGGDRVMAYGYDTNSNIDMGFGDECTGVLVAAGQAGYCSGANKCHCGGDGEQQHDLRTLQAIYAPPGPDMVPPTISITTPEDGAHFAQGESIVVEVDPWDDYGGYGWELVVSQGDTILGEVVDYEISQQFVLKGLPPGTFTLTARVQDQEDHITEHVITITVDGEASEDSEGSDTDTPATSDTPTTSDTNDASSGASDSEDAGSSGDTDPGMDGADDGCSCRSDAPTPTAITGLLGLILLGLRRRARGS